MLFITTTLAALIGLMFFGSMASAVAEMRRERSEADDLSLAR